MLLLSNQCKITLAKPAQKILKICPTIKDTFLLICLPSDSYYEQKLVHIDKSGKTLWEKSYKGAIDTFGLLYQREAIVLNTEKNQIQIIDLITYESRFHAHTFSFPNSSSMELHTFYDTKFFCVQEVGLIGDGKLILTYYMYTSHSFKCISQFKSSEGAWKPGHLVSKANNHSKIAWWDQVGFTDQIVFNFWQLSQDSKNQTGSLSKIKCRNTLPALLGLQSMTLTIAQIWQSKPDTYMLVCNTNYAYDGMYKHYYVIDAISGIIRRPKFNFYEQMYADVSFIHFFNLGAYSVFLASTLKAGSSENASVYYIDNNTEGIICKDRWKASTKSHFYLPGFDPNGLIEAIHDNGDVKQVKVITKRLMTVCEMFLHLLLHLNEDFDDDLLQDALDILGCI